MKNPDYEKMKNYFYENGSDLKTIHDYVEKEKAGVHVYWLCLWVFTLILFALSIFVK